MIKEIKPEDYGVGPKTLEKWKLKGDEVGRPVPWDRPDEMRDWYFYVFGREMLQKVQDRIAEMMRDDEDAAPLAASRHALPVDREALNDFLERLGVGRQLIQLESEIDRAWTEYQAALKMGGKGRTEREAWMKMSEMKRAMSKTDDPVQAAVRVFQAWARGDWAAEQTEMRRRLSGRVAGLQWRERLRATSNEEEWAKTWDAMLTEILTDEK